MDRYFLLTVKEGVETSYSEKAAVVFTRCTPFEMTTGRSVYLPQELRWLEEQVRAAELAHQVCRILESQAVELKRVMVENREKMSRARTGTVIYPESSRHEQGKQLSLSWQASWCRLILYWRKRSGKKCYSRRSSRQEGLAGYLKRKNW
ncbi:MAG: hypothetical protein ACFFD4_09750 [Candidatus Odinarchaeota archaeon]